MSTEIWFLPSIAALIFNGVTSFLPKVALRNIKALDYVVFHAIFFFSFGAIAQFFMGGLQFDLRAAIIAILSGAFGTIGQLLYLSALQRGPLAHVSMVSALYPLVATFLGYLFLHETLSAGQVAGIFLGIFSIILLVAAASPESIPGSPHPEQKNKAPHWLPPAFGALIAWAIWSFIPKIAVQSVPASSALFYAGLGDIIVALPVYLFGLRGRLDIKNRNGIAVAVLSSCLAASATLMYFYALSHGPVGAIATLTAMYPVITVALAYFLLKEKITRRQLLAIIIAVGSIILLTR